MKIQSPVSVPSFFSSSLDIATINLRPQHFTFICLYVLVAGVCILLFDELESICQEKKQGGPSFRRAFPFLFGSFLRIVEKYPGLIIIATTNNIGALHSHIRCAGRMEVEVFGIFSVEVICWIKTRGTDAGLCPFRDLSPIVRLISFQQTFD